MNELEKILKNGIDMLHSLKQFKELNYIASYALTKYRDLVENNAMPRPIGDGDDESGVHKP